MKFIVTITTIGDYRDFFLRLLALHFPGLRIMVGRDFFYPAGQLSAFIVGMAQTTVVRNNFFLGRRLNWQSLYWRLSLARNVVVGEFYPRVLSATWALLLKRRDLSRRTLVWRHVCARPGPRSGSDSARNLMLRLAPAAVLHTHSQSTQPVKRYPQLAQKLLPATAATLTQALRPLLGPNAVLSSDGNAAYWGVADELKVEAGFFVTQYCGKGGNGPWHVQGVNRYDSSLKSWMVRFRVVATKYLPHYLGWRRLLDRFKDNLTAEQFLFHALRRAYD